MTPKDMQRRPIAGVDHPGAKAGREPGPVLSAFCVLATLALVARFAGAADNTITRPGDHPSYSVEIEPHVLFGWGDVYHAGGYGLGGRFSIPVVHNGFVPTINNSVAISFGVDWMHYDWCWYNGSCAANYFDFPVVMQWNFFVARRWSVFGEPGLVLYFGSYGDCGLAANLCPGHPSGTGLEPALFIGGRYHLSDKTSLTMRLGFPSFSFGFSFFP
ncbi:MAG TPA: hypothetical protein VN894_01060 [Polyangiaceae bacterium]|nr:hypothetical protein [Polyangiaceae bacterium]